MNPRERYLKALRREKVDKVPKQAWFTPEIEKIVEEKVKK